MAGNGDSVRSGLSLPAFKVQQHAQEFYLLNQAAADIERLVRFEVPGEAAFQGTVGERPRAKASLVNWEAIETRVVTSDKAYQRSILQRKIDELARYHLQGHEDGAVPPPLAPCFSGER